jgi:hypothetical protein
VKSALIWIAALGVFASTPAWSQGLNLYWNDCSVAGASLERFACDTNEGSHTLVVSFIAPDSVFSFVSAESRIFLLANASDPPDWWRLRNQSGQLNQCRTGALATSSDFTTGPSSCADLFRGQGAGGVNTYQVGYGGNFQVKLQVIHSLPTIGAAHPLTPGIEYYACKVIIDNRKTIGADACGGCNVGLLLWLDNVRLLQPAGSPGGNRDVYSYYGDHRLASWQCIGFCGLHDPCNFDCTTPTRTNSWGQIKSLYR